MNDTYDIIRGTIMLCTLVFTGIEFGDQALAQTPAITNKNQPQAIDFQRIAANKDLWPKTLLLTAAVDMPLVFDGKTAGSVNLPAGQTVQLLSVGADGTLIIAANGNRTKISADKTNFGDAEKSVVANAAAQRTAYAQQQAQRQQQEKELQDQATAQAAAEKQKERELRLIVEIVQVLDKGVLARIPEGGTNIANDDPASGIGYNTVYIEGVGKGNAEGDVIKIKAYRDGTFSYGSVVGAQTTVQKWIFVPMDDTPTPSPAPSKYVSPLDKPAN